MPVRADEQTASLHTELAGEDHPYEYQEIGHDGKVDSALPKTKEQPDPDYIDPNAERSALLSRGCHAAPVWGAPEVTGKHPSWSDGVRAPPWAKCR